MTKGRHPAGPGLIPMISALGECYRAISTNGEWRMNSRRASASALMLALSMSIPQGAVAQDTTPAPRGSTAMPRPAGPHPIAREGVIEDEAIDDLKEMSAFLMQAKTLAISTEGTIDTVTADGQRIQLDGTTQYKIRRPGFVIDYVSDMKSRRFIYDGKNFTVYSPKLGFYAQVPAPGTNKEVLDTIYNKFGISLPLVDLFRWADP